MSRPTTYCATCGEYVAKKTVTYNGDTWKLRWVHVSETGATIDRRHSAIMEGDES